MSKFMGIYVKFTKTTHKIWSCHVTLASNSEKFYFSANFILNFRESYKIRGKLAQEHKSYRQKTNRGGGRPSTTYRVNMATSTYFDNTVVCSDVKLIFGTCIP